MSKPAVKDTWNFGSFLCVRRTPGIFLDESRQAAEPSVAGRIVVESPVAAPAGTLDGRCGAIDAGSFDAGSNLHVLPGSGAQAASTERCA